MKIKNDIRNFLSIQVIFQNKMHNKNDVGTIIEILNLEQDIQVLENMNDGYTNEEVHYENMASFLFFGKYKN